MHPGLDACTDVCMHVCIVHGCMLHGVYVCMYACRLHVRMSVCMHVQTSVCMNACLWACVDVRTCIGIELGRQVGSSGRQVGR